MKSGGRRRPFGRRVLGLRRSSKNGWIKASNCIDNEEHKHTSTNEYWTITRGNNKQAFSLLCFTKLMHIINKTSILCTTILYSQQCIADLENIAIILKPGRQLLGAYACGISGYGLIITSHDTNVKEVKGHE